MIEQAEKLLSVLQTMKDNELAKTASLAHELDRFEARRRELSMAMAQRTEGERPPADMAASDRWLRWCGQERERIGVEMSRLAAQLEEQKQRARSALARFDALESLVRKQAHSAKRLQRLKQF